MHLLFNPANTVVLYNKRDTSQPYRVVDLSNDNRPQIVWFAKTKEEAEAFLNDPIPFRNKVEKEIDKRYSLKAIHTN